MAIHITKKQKVDSQFKMVKLQLLLHTFFREIDLTDSDLNCAAFLAIKGFNKHFFKDVVEAKIFKSEQSARNCMSKLRSAKVAVRDGKDWKINPEIVLGVDKVILLELTVANL